MRARAVTFIIVRLDARQRLLVLLRVHEQLKKELRKGSPNAQIPWLTVFITRSMLCSKHASPDRMSSR